VRVVATEGKGGRRDCCGSGCESSRPRATFWLIGGWGAVAKRKLGDEPQAGVRLYREEGLAVRRKQRHSRVKGTARVPLRLPTRANQVWTMGSPNTRLRADGNFRTLNLMDIMAGLEGDCDAVNGSAS